MSRPTREERRALSLLCAAVLEREQRAMTIRNLQDALAPLGIEPTWPQVRSACIDAMWSSFDNSSGYSRPTGPVVLVPSWALVERQRRDQVAFAARSAGLLAGIDDLDAMFDSPPARRDP